MTPREDTVLKILAVRLGRLGDMVMITPALDTLLAKYPDSQLTLLTSPEGRRVLADFDPRVVDVWVHRRKSLFPAIERSAIQRRIVWGKFDLIHLFESKPSYRALVEGAAARVVALPERETAGTVIHYAERCLRSVDADATPRRVRLPVWKEGRAKADALLREFDIDKQTFLVGFHPTFAEKRRFGDAKVRRHKQWPIAKWAELAHRLHGEAMRRGVPIRIVTDLMPEDRALGQTLEAASDRTVTAIIGEADFDRYKATLARMNLLVAPDTGPMHLAAAVGTPVVALFSGKNPADCGPYTDANRKSILRAESSPGWNELGLAALEVERVVDGCLRFFPGRR